MQSIDIASQTGKSRAVNPLVRRSVAERTPVLTHLYIWSIVLEPLLFFVLFERTTSGLTSNLARMIQLVVLALLALKYVFAFFNSASASIRVPNFTHLRYFNYGVYFSLAAMAGLIGILSGAYDVPQAYSYNNVESGFSRLLNSAAMRPLVEYGIALYYFFYFSVLPQYFFRTEKDLRCFFSIFKAVFVISFLVGAIELALDSHGAYFVPRHLADGRYVGWRFHGLAGEPRDAFLYLFFGLAMLHLQAHFNGRTLNKWWIPAIVIAALLTQSASGLLGLIFFAIFYGIYSFGKLSFKRIVRLLILLMLVTVLISAAVIYSARIMNYLDSAANLWTILETRGEIPYLMAVQIENIYPLYDLTVKLRDLNILPVLIGSGLGSTSIINNIYDPTIGGMANPHSQFVRLIFESGLIGTFFFVMSFVYPVIYYVRQLSPKKQHEFILLTLLLLGCSFAHRSATGFIYLGIFISTFCILNKKKNQIDRDPSSARSGDISTS